MLNTCFPSESLEFGELPGRGGLRDQYPRKIPGPGVFNELPVGNTSQVFQQRVAGGFKHILCDSVGRGLWKLLPGFPWTSPFAPFLC